MPHKITKNKWQAKVKIGNAYYHITKCASKKLAEAEEQKIERKIARLLKYNLDSYRLDYE